MVHCWYSLGRPVTIGTPMALTIFDDWYSVPFVKNSQKTVKTAKSPLVYQSSHVYTESAEYTKPRKRLARPPSQCAWAVATARRPWAGLTVCVDNGRPCVWLPFAAVCCYILFYLLMMPAARLVCQRPSSTPRHLICSIISQKVTKFSIFSDPIRKLSALPPELRRIR